MALPLIAAGVAARAVAKKLATRAAGGITGKGAKQVNPVYRNQTDQIQKNSVKVKPAARQKAGKKDIQQFINKRAVRNDNINYQQRGNDSINSGMQQPGPFSQGKTKLMRQIKASNKKSRGN
jgi:hypothetical protein